MARDLATAKPQASTAKAPYLPESLRRLLADPFRMAGEGAVEWQPPEVPPETVKLRSAATELEAGLKPATPGHVTWCCNKLFVLPTRDGSAISAAFMTDNFIDVCGQFPDDLWSAGTLEILKNNTFRPTPAEMFKIIAPKLADRQRMLERIRMMIAGSGQKALDKPAVVVVTAARERLRGILSEQRVKAYADESHRTHDMAHTERALAYEERRPMADWARQFFDDRVAAQEGSVPRSVGQHAKAAISPTNRRLAELAAAKRDGRQPAPWKAGDVVYQQSHEPPPPTEEPMGAEA